MPKYSHAYDFAFELISDREDAEDVTGAMLRAALQSRLNSIPDSEMLEACGLFDTAEVDYKPMPKIEPYIHECYGDDGELYRTPVEAADIEFKMKCHKCGIPLADPVQIMAHIYRELTE